MSKLASSIWPQKVFSISMAKEHCVWLHLSEEANPGEADMAVHGNIDAIDLTDLPIEQSSLW
ncbi:MAG: hypothetical protein H0V72_11465 [Bradyrhizobium sp.]|nr:hypothetical protein [Bradyrhizobium sp.]MBA3726765.1 hypothetical protein [Armatimonadota bacterium]